MLRLVPNVDNIQYPLFDLSLIGDDVRVSANSKDILCHLLHHSTFLQPHMSVIHLLMGKDLALLYFADMVPVFFRVNRVEEKPNLLSGQPLLRLIHALNESVSPAINEKCG